jgi:hypothetical protein
MKIYEWLLILLMLSPALSLAQEPGEPADSPYNAPFSQSRFVPDISLILDVSYVQRNMSDDSFRQLEIPGFVHAPAEEPEDGHEHGGMNAHRGFNFNYGELVVASAVDPYFDLFATFHLSAESFEVEEGYFVTRALPLGFQLKAGKFLSSFGRMNEQHPHYWDFADTPLVLGAFFGPEGLNEIGLRLSWLAPLPFYLAVGGEMMEGENEMSFGGEGFEDVNGTVSVSDSASPNLYTAYLKTSFDIGGLVALLGVSGSRGKSRMDHGIDVTGEEGHAVYADTGIYGLDVTLKYLIDSYRYVSLQAEYVYRDMDGDLYEKDAADAVVRSSLEKKQAGMYAQLVFRFSRQWRTGARYDLLGKNDVVTGGTRDDGLPDNLPRYSGMLEWNPSEFSRFRAQYNHDLTRYAEDAGELKRRVNREIIIQCNMAIGAHGAHSF